VDRNKLPPVGTPPDAEFPGVRRTTLSNGLRLVLAERRSIPQVRFDLVLDAGYAADQLAAPGTAAMTLAMLDEADAEFHRVGDDWGRALVLFVRSELHFLTSDADAGIVCSQQALNLFRALVSRNALQFT